jgi:hypothetical protein
MFLANRHSLWLRLLFMVGAVVLFVFGYQWGNQHQLFVFAPGGYLVALFTADADRAGIAADLAVLHQHLDLLLPEGT